jgi:hypothetical protein
VRLCFTRKNKSLSAIFRAKSVIDLLQSNYSTYCALNNVVRAATCLDVLFWCVVCRVSRLLACAHTFRNCRRAST